MKTKQLLIYIFLFFYSAIFCSAQMYPQNYFSSPLDTAFAVIGTFGEIRQDHFHSGIDLSTGEQEGKPVLSAADGYVSRIKVASNGFGKALYITHPNGYVTVYAHLKSFTEPIQRFVLKEQYKQLSFEVELNPNPKEFRITKGKVIAYSGNSGDSEGPHLHFEIRDAATEEPINPLLFGFAVKDTIPPLVKAVRIIPVQSLGVVNTTDTAASYNVVRNGGEYKLDIRDYVQVYGLIGLAVNASDSRQGSSSRLGIYSVEVTVDSEVVYRYKLDRFNFNETRYANALIDYGELMRDHLIFIRCTRLPGNHLRPEPDPLENGIIEFDDDDAHDVAITLSDFNGNSSVIKFQLLSYASLADLPSQPVPQDAYAVTDKKGIALHQSNLEVSIPSGAVYEKTMFTTYEMPVREKFFSHVYRIGDDIVPIHSFVNIGIKPVNIPDQLKPKAVIVSLDENNRMQSEGGDWIEPFLFAKVKHFGEFAIAVDTISPIIRKLYSLSTIAKEEKLQFKISDDLSGIKNYSATLDGKWFLFEYSSRDHLLTGDLSGVSKKSSHQLKLVVTDKRDNVSAFEDVFTF
jgi:hypothetical protein